MCICVRLGLTVCIARTDAGRGLLFVQTGKSKSLSYFDWNGSKVIKEFFANGPVKFIFQYRYYLFATVLVMLILVFGQNAFEMWFHKRNIRYGGMIAAITWGIGHFITKDVTAGIVTVISGLSFGSVYLLVNRVGSKVDGLVDVPEKL